MTRETYKQVNKYVYWKLVVNTRVTILSRHRSSYCYVILYYRYYSITISDKSIIKFRQIQRSIKRGVHT